jgi:hypothetical protein
VNNNKFKFNLPISKIISSNYFNFNNDNPFKTYLTLRIIIIIFYSNLNIIPIKISNIKKKKNLLIILSKITKSLR